MGEELLMLEKISGSEARFTCGRAGIIVTVTTSLVAPASPDSRHFESRPEIKPVVMSRKTQ